MSVKQLTKEQKKRIEEVKAEWLKEMGSIPDSGGGQRLDGGGGPYKALETKYMKKINKIANE